VSDVVVVYGEITHVVSFCFMDFSLCLLEKYDMIKGESKRERRGNIHHTDNMTDGADVPAVIKKQAKYARCLSCSTSMVA